MSLVCNNNIVVASRTHNILVTVPKTPGVKLSLDSMSRELCNIKPAEKYDVLIQRKEQSNIVIKLFGITARDNQGTGNIPVCPPTIPSDGIEEAPKDSELYGRINGNWQVIPDVIPPPSQVDIYTKLMTNSSIGGHRVVSTQNGYACYADNIDIQLPAIGLSIAAVGPGEIVDIQTFGSLEIPGATFIPGEAIFVSTAGGLTQVAPHVGFTQKIGIAHTSNVMIIEVTQPIFL